MPCLIWFSKVHLKPFCSLSDVVASTTALNTGSSTATSIIMGFLDRHFQSAVHQFQILLLVFIVCFLYVA